MVRGFYFGLILSLFSVSVFAKVDPAKVKKWEERKQFAAKDSTEATVTFEHSVELTSKTKPSREKQLDIVDEQLWHLFGPLSEAAMYAVPKNDQQITLIGEPEPKEGEKNRWVVSYKYEGTMQIKNGAASKFHMVLPVDPKAIYEAGFVRGKNPCTDDHYQSQGDFWYFWNPAKKGCKLKAGVDYTEVENAKIVRIANTKRTYPEYDRLVDKEGVIRIHFLLGLDEPRNSQRNRNPLKSSDLNAFTYREIRNSLIEMGYTQDGKAWTEKQLQEIVPSNVSVERLPFVEVFSREGTRKIKKGRAEIPVRIEVRMFFGVSGISEEDNTPFHYFYKDALENAAVVLYDGHSGLGGHLSLPDIEETNGFKIRFNPNYQILFINSCTSYTYYNAAYFERKGSSKNLDILVNGLATMFGVLHDTNLALVKGIDLWADKKRPVRTYQDLANTIDSSNLFSVNGDEDNPTTVAEVGG